MSPYRRGTATATCCAVLLVVTGCATAPGDPRGPDRAVLAARVPLEWATAVANAHRRELLAVVGTSAGSLAWSIAPDGGTGECRPPYDGLGGRTGLLGDSSARTSTSSWPAVLPAATRSAASNGYTAVEVERDDGDVHLVRFSSDDGGWLELGTDAAGTTVRAATGCHPPA